MGNCAGFERIKPTDVIFVLGGPGSGKGTQCALLAERHAFAHFSAGDLLREEVASGSEQGQLAAALMAEGKIVPAEVTITLLKKAMASRPGPYLIDGFPRSMENASAYEAELGIARCVLFFQVGLETLERRLLQRAETSGRADDKIEVIRKRFETFEQTSMPVVAHLQKSMPVYRIAGEGDVEAVFAAVERALKLSARSRPSQGAVAPPAAGFPLASDTK